MVPCNCFCDQSIIEVFITFLWLCFFNIPVCFSSFYFTAMRCVPFIKVTYLLTNLHLPLCTWPYVQAQQQSLLNDVRTMGFVTRWAVGQAWFCLERERKLHSATPSYIESATWRHHIVSYKHSYRHGVFITAAGARSRTRRTTLGSTSHRPWVLPVVM